MMKLETPVIESGGEVIVAFDQDDHLSDPWLELCGEDDQLIKVTQNHVAESRLHFHLPELHPGFYNLGVVVRPGQQPLSEEIIVATKGFAERARAFKRAVQQLAAMRDKSEIEIKQELSVIRADLSAVGLDALADDVGRGISVPRAQAPIDTRATVKIKYIKSIIGAPEPQKRIVKALGLRKLNQVVERPNTSSFRGFVKKVPHLLSLVD